MWFLEHLSAQLWIRVNFLCASFNISNSFQNFFFYKCCCCWKRHGSFLKTRALTISSTFIPLFFFSFVFSVALIPTLLFPLALFSFRSLHLCFPSPQCQTSRRITGAVWVNNGGRKKWPLAYFRRISMGGASPPRSVEGSWPLTPMPPHVASSLCNLTQVKLVGGLPA